ncbi:type VI secretion protein ImpB [Pseudogemmobacter blasticus]|uniref:DNA-directed DNA polymerase n=1 Tax=Fuscovulum blasticum DSM 2131 TaxID=1188250 RepID=A0A2T4J8P6_FUSBL|nr:type VI secretion protein ImpB [Fuscovulum blasticum]PTE14275.1 type VI secretion protein ImpB [Fuscovulum blasticum DSM 2131]
MDLHVSTLFFDMNSFYASVAQAEEPALMGRPVGVLTTDAPNAGCIAASIDAKRLGVGMGTRQDEARRLCPGIVFRPVRHDVCVRYHHAILAAVETVVPVHRIWSIDECSCLLTGSEQRLDRALAIGRALQQAVLDRVHPALRCSVGLGPTRLLAKVAAGLEKPGGLHWLLPHVLPDRIAHLALDDLPGISRRMKLRLEAAGIPDVRALFALDPKRARAIWHSVTGERFLRELRGETVIWPETRRGMIGHGQVLTAGNKTPEGARLVARRLLVKAAARLRREGFLARSLHVSVRSEDGASSAQEGQIRATQDTFFLLQTLDRYWSGLRLRRLRAVNVMLGGLIAEGQVTDDLFESPGPAAEAGRAGLCRAIDALNQRFGQDTVHFGSLPPHRVPYTGAKIAFGRIPVAEDFLE